MTTKIYDFPFKKIKGTPDEIWEREKEDYYNLCLNSGIRENLIEEALEIFKKGYFDFAESLRPVPLDTSFIEGLDDEKVKQINLSIDEFVNKILTAIIKIKMGSLAMAIEIAASRVDG